MGISSLSNKSRVVVSKDQVSCDLAGEVAILNLKTGIYYGLNPVGARIWSLVQAATTFAEIRDTLLDCYDVEQPTLESDIRDLLDKLAEQGLVEVRQ